ncbi:MAG: DUF58 domain-containing protein [Acidimicrobiia bacterium]
MGTGPALTPERVVQRLEWHVLRRLDGRLQGDYRTLLRGVGMDFRDIRDYEPGDDVRHIDWNVTARMDTPFVREFSEDRELTAWLLLDRSPSMSFGAAERPKDLVLCEVATAIARLLVKGGNLVGAVLYDGAIGTTLRPRSGRNQALLLARELLKPIEPRKAVTDLTTLAESAAAMIKRRSLVIVISDFISEPGWDAALRRLTERHEVVALRIVDPREFDLPDAGLIVVEDTETGEQIVIDSSDPVFRENLRRAGEEREAALQAMTRRAGVDLHDISTDDDLANALLRVVESRRRRSA